MNPEDEDKSPKAAIRDVLNNLSGAKEFDGAVVPIQLDETTDSSDREDILDAICNAGDCGVYQVSPLGSIGGSTEGDWSGHLAIIEPKEGQEGEK